MTYLEGIAAGAESKIRGGAQSQHDLTMTGLSWDREDTAVQRRVADMKAAGINPTLAAGAAAQSSGPVSMKSGPARQRELANQTAQVASNLIQMQANVSKTRAEKALTDKQTEGQGLTNQYLKETMEPRKDIVSAKAIVAKATAPAEINRIEAMARRGVRQDMITALDYKLKGLEVDVSLITTGWLKRFASNYGIKGLNPEELEYVAKKVALDAAQHNLAWAREHKLPTSGYSPSRFGKIVIDILGLGDRAADFYDSEKNKGISPPSARQ